VLDRAAAVLRAGGVIIYPTDTLYGLAVDPTLPAAVGRLLALKGRPQGQPLPLIAGSIEEADASAGRLSETARRLARRFWPGPLTVLVEAREGLAPGVADADGSVAVRVPAHAVARRLAAAAGGVITSTSANQSGGEASAAATRAAESLGAEVDLVLDAGATPGGAPSTIVDTRHGPVRLVRAGVIPFEHVLEAAARR
jgi:L-threonylcarbamoyladenylate synthase